VRVAGALQSSPSIPPGGTSPQLYPSLLGGPVKVECDIAVVVTERSIFMSSFNEVNGVPQSDFNTTWWFTWYDSFYMFTWVMIVNPSTTQTANCTVHVGGTLRGSPSVGPGGVAAEFYRGIIGGPVKVQCDIPVLATERSTFHESFNEVVGFLP
jgi:hypothetical protein